jgi:hypothetical protein
VTPADDVREAARVLRWAHDITEAAAPGGGVAFRTHAEALEAAADRLDYLERALAVERLDPAAAPEGWVVSSGQWYHPGLDILVSRSVGKEGVTWVRVEGGGRGCLYPCAWDAISGEVDDE